MAVHKYTKTGVPTEHPRMYKQLYIQTTGCEYPCICLLLTVLCVVCLCVCVYVRVYLRLAYTPPCKYMGARACVFVFERLRLCISVLCSCAHLGGASVNLCHQMYFQFEEDDDRTIIIVIILTSSR